MSKTELFTLATVCVFAFSVSGCSDDPAGLGDRNPDTGTIGVTTVTTGDDPDPNGFGLLLDAVPAGNIGVNETLGLTNVLVGTHELELTELATNCSVTVANARTIIVTKDEITPTTFEVTCPVITN